MTSVFWNHLWTHPHEEKHPGAGLTNHGMNLKFNSFLAAISSYIAMTYQEQEMFSALAPPTQNTLPTTLYIFSTYILIIVFVAPWGG